MKYVTKFIATAVAVMIATQIPSFSAFADEQDVYRGTCGSDGDNITWIYDASTQTLTFSGTGSLNTYDWNKTFPWLEGETGEIYDARNVIVKDGITGLGNALYYAFQGKDGNRFDPEECSVTIPESVTTWDEYPIRSFVNVYVKYGSKIYYWLTDSNNHGWYSYHGTGVAKNEKYPTTGTTSTGLTYDFDYETATLTLDGTDGFTDDPEKYFLPFSYIDEIVDIYDAAETVIIEKDFVVPDTTGTSNSNGKWKYMEDNYGYVLSLIDMHYGEDHTIYYYKGSDFEKDYQELSDYVSENYNSFYINNMKCIDEETLVTTTESTAEVETTTTTTTKSTAQTGDVNLDSSVDLIDAVYLNKYVANVVNLTDTQLQDADCNGDGNVTDQDTAILMKYLVCSISELPYTE